MNADEITILTHFLIRTEMYIGKETKSNIISFLIGFQMGINKEYKEFDDFFNFLQKKYRIGNQSQSWWGQVEEYSKKNNLEWCVSIKRLLFDYFYSINDFENNLEFVEIHKSRIKKLIDNYNDEYDVKAKWESFVILNNENFVSIWNEEELKEINLIEKKLR